MKYTSQNKLYPIEVVYLSPDKQCIISLKVPEGATIGSAIIQSGILAEFPNIDLNQHKTGIFGCVLPLSHPLQEGDRVEIYRPLLIDPKKARRLRAK